MTAAAAAASAPSPAANENDTSHEPSLVRLPTLPSPSFLRHPHSIARWGGLSSRAKQPKIKLDKRPIPNERRTDQENHNLLESFAGINGNSNASLTCRSFLRTFRLGSSRPQTSPIRRQQMRESQIRLDISETFFSLRHNQPAASRYRINEEETVMMMMEL